MTLGTPCVSVPVLSNTTVQQFAKASRWLPPLMSIPLRAALPIPALTAVGGESPTAHGQAISEHRQCSRRITRQ